MIVKISKEKVFWNTIGDNKPSTTYLNQFVSRMVQQDIKINFVDFYNINVVSSTRDITYILTTHNNYNQYWFFNGIEKIINGGYVLKFQLDIWTTYTLPFFDLMNQNNIKVKLNRSHKFTKEALLLKDNMLDNVPIVYENYVDRYYNPTTYSIPNQNGVRYFLNSNRNSYVEYQVSGSGDLGASGNYYYVFQDVNEDGYMWFIPVLYDEDFGTNVNGIYYQLNDPLNKQKNLIQIYNTSRELEKLRQAPDPNNSDKPSDLANKFLGCYLLPNFFNYKNTKLKYDWITRHIDNVDKTYACLTLKVSGEVINDPIVLDEYPDFVPYNNQITTLNYTDKVHQFAFDKLDYQFFGQSIPAKLLIDNNKVVINDWMVNFTQSCFIKLFNKTNDLFGYSEGIIELPANLPVWIDTYLNYVNANKNTRDNQLNILKQERDKALSVNSIGGFFGAIGNLFNRDGGGLFSNIFDTGVGVANTITGYNNALSTMKAQYEDAKNTMGDTIQAGNIVDAINGYFNYKFSNIYNKIRYKKLSANTIANLNNVIYLYGISNPQIDTLTHFTVRSDFNYYLFDQQYLNTIFANHIANNVPQELYPFIINQLSEGVRIWTIQPNN